MGAESARTGAINTARVATHARTTAQARDVPPFDNVTSLLPPFNFWMINSFEFRQYGWDTRDEEKNQEIATKGYGVRGRRLTVTTVGSLREGKTQQEQQRYTKRHICPRKTTHRNPPFQTCALSAFDPIRIKILVCARTASCPSSYDSCHATFSAFLIRRCGPHSSGRTQQMILRRKPPKATSNPHSCSRITARKTVHQQTLQQKAHEQPHTVCVHVRTPGQNLSPTFDRHEKAFSWWGTEGEN